MPTNDTDKEQYELIRDLEKKVAALEAKQQMLLAMLGGLGLAIGGVVAKILFG